MAVSSVASPLRTWLLAACMSVDYEKAQSVKPSLLKSSNGRSLWARRKAVLSTFIGRSVGSEFSKSVVSTVMSSCLSFVPFEEFYSSKGLCSSLAFLDNGFWRFGSKAGDETRRKKQMARAVLSGAGTMAVSSQTSKESTTKKKPLMKERQVVVTGMGVVTPIGHDLDVFYNNLLDVVCGISQIEAFDCSHFPTRIAGEIKSFSTDGWVAPKLSKRADKFMLYMLYMLTPGKKALTDGGISEYVMKELDKTRCGVLIGSAMGGMKVFNDVIEALRVSYRKMNPFCVPFATTNMGSAMLAVDLGWMGPNYSISTASATSNFCILNAANHIIRGEADIMLCGGSDSTIIPIGLGGFVACGSLSQRNNDPTKASRPWDVNRDGFVMGEGAGVLLLEELEHAKTLRQSSLQSNQWRLLTNLRPQLLLHKTPFNNKIPPPLQSYQVSVNHSPSNLIEATIFCGRINW